jgi:hypothetical protein
MTMFVRAGGELWRRDQELHDNVLVDTSKIPAVLARSDIRAEVRTSFGNETLPSGLVAVIGYPADGDRAAEPAARTAITSFPRSVFCIREFLAAATRSGQSGAMAALYPVHEFADVVALLVGAADDNADLSEVRIHRTDAGLYVHFETRTPQAFLGPKRTRATALRNALAEKLGDPELRLTVGRPPPDEARP